MRHLVPLIARKINKKNEKAQITLDGFADFSAQNLQVLKKVLIFVATIEMI